MGLGLGIITFLKIWTLFECFCSITNISPISTEKMGHLLKMEKLKRIQKFILVPLFK